MTHLALVISLLLAGLGALGVIAPSRLLAFARGLQAPAGIYSVALLRIVFGVALFSVAPSSRAPELIRVLGVIAVVSGVITPVFVSERFRRFPDWWLARDPKFVRLWAAIPLGLGLFLAYAVAL